MTAARTIMVLGSAALFAVGALRIAAVAAPPDAQWVSPARVWPSHPAVRIDRAMTLIGQSARLGQGVPGEARGLLAKAATGDPLAPEPFLVEGARAQMDGRMDEVAALFEAARARDPRSGAARYFLAGHYLDAGRPAEALAELSVMGRLVPGTEAQFVPSLIAFARQPAAAPVLRRFFARSPTYRAIVLAGLAQDAANAGLILALAGTRAPGTPPDAWESAIVNKLIEGGQPGRAQIVWRRLAGVAPYDGVFNPRFIAQSAPAPFNWSYDASGAGLVTPDAGGGLDLVYYGRRDVVLAEEMLLLAPGSYRLVTDVGGTATGALGWQVACAGTKAILLQAPLVANGAILRVPAEGCAAQSLRLTGSSVEGEPSASVTIGSVRIVGGAAR